MGAPGSSCIVGMGRKGGTGSSPVQQPQEVKKKEPAAKAATESALIVFIIVE